MDFRQFFVSGSQLTYHVWLGSAHSGTVHSGGRWVEVNCDINKAHVYIQAGGDTQGRFLA